MLSSCPESNIVTDAASVTECFEVLESFAGTTVEPGCSPWVYVDCFDNVTVFKELVISYREIRVIASDDEGVLDVSAPGTMCVQSSLPARFDMSKVRSPESVASLVKMLRCSLSRCGAGSWKD